MGTLIADLCQKWLFEMLYRNRHLYRFASTVPFAGKWRIWQRLVLSRLHGHFVLELGCGLGDLLADMIEAGYDCRAIEQSLEMVNAARETLHSRHCGKPTWVVQGQTQCLPFTTASFDTVISTFPSEYIYDPKTIFEIERVLRPGGRLIVLFNARLLPVDSVQSFLLLIQMFVYGPSVFFRAKEDLHKYSELNTGVIVENVNNTEWGKKIPLEEYKLRRSYERIYSQSWEAYIVIGEK